MQGGDDVAQGVPFTWLASASGHAETASWPTALGALARYGILGATTGRVSPR